MFNYNNHKLSSSSLNILGAGIKCYQCISGYHGECDNANYGYVAHCNIDHCMILKAGKYSSMTDTPNHKAYC